MTRAPGGHKWQADIWDHLKAFLSCRGQPVHKELPRRADAFDNSLLPLLVRTCPGMAPGAHCPVQGPAAEHSCALLDRRDMLRHLRSACAAANRRLNNIGRVTRSTAAVCWIVVTCFAICAAHVPLQTVR